MQPVKVYCVIKEPMVNPDILILTALLLLITCLVLMPPGPGTPLRDQINNR